jgi:organic radical activating enzyme
VTFGITEMTMGFAEKKEKIPAGLTETAGMAAEKLTGVQGLKKAGEITDLGIQVISGGNPVKKVDKIFKLVPSSAKEAAKLGSTKLKIFKEVADLTSQVTSTYQLEQAIEDYLNQKNNNDNNKKENDDNNKKE